MSKVKTDHDGDLNVRINDDVWGVANFYNIGANYTLYDLSVCFGGWPLAAWHSGPMTDGLIARKCPLSWSLI